MTLTMVQLLSISLYSGPLLQCWNIRPGLQSSFSKDYYWKLIIPLAFGKFLSSVFSHISIWKVPVSFAHTGTKPVDCSYKNIQQQITKLK
jgi:solute carrier family 35 protein E1